MMIRKFVAFLFLIIFVFVIPPLLIVESIAVTYLDKATVKESVIPKSYEITTALLAEQFSRDSEEIILFSDRIRTALPRDSYSDLLSGAADTIFETIESVGDNIESGALTADLSNFKETVRGELPGFAERFPVCGADEKIDESFRFCRPRDLPSGADFETVATNILDKEIPSHFTIGSSENPEIAQYISNILSAKKILPFLIGIISLVLLGIIALLVFSPPSSILKWIGSALLYLLALVVLFLFSLARLPELIPIYEGFSPAQIDLINFLVDQVSSTLSLWIFFIGVAGIILFGSGVLLGTKKAKK